MPATNPEITVSSQPFEPGSVMKKRKTAHDNEKSNNKSTNSQQQQQPSTFEEELKRLDQDVTMDLTSKKEKRRVRPIKGKEFNCIVL